jgi:hypothetical protein
MSTASFPNLDRFLRGVRRRLMLLRLIEHMGIAVAISCAAALPLIFLLAWHGAGSMMPVVLCVALGIVAGIAWGATRIPTVLEAALEADRQLQWADLLGSALLLRAAPDDPWRRAVLVAADRRCRGLSPSSIFLGRLSPRTWSGIALSLVLTLGLSALIGSPTNSLAHDVRSSAIADSTQNRDPGNQLLLSPLPIDAARLSAAPPEGQDSMSDSATNPASDRANDTPANSPDLFTRGFPSTDGQGGLLGRSRSRSPDQQTFHTAASTGSSLAAHGKPAGGNAAAAADLRIDGETVGGTVAPGARRGPANVPWTASEWPRQAEAAQRAVTNGSLPAPFRDLIRDYFQRN